MYNTILYIGVTLMMSGFIGFIWCEMKVRETDRKLWELNEKMKRLKN